MSILSINTINPHDDGSIYVAAVVEDAVQTHAQTLYDPPEYGPALCEACFTLEEDEILPDNEHELIQFLEDLDLNWELIDNSDYYLD
jgi:hypothetical protein